MNKHTPTPVLIVFALLVTVSAPSALGQSGVGRVIAQAHSGKSHSQAAADVAMKPTLTSLTQQAIRRPRRPLQYYPGLLPNRDARLHSPYCSNYPCEVNGDYLVRGGDAIQFLLQKKGLPAPRICPDEATAIIPDDPTTSISLKPLLNIDYEEGRKLIVGQARPQIPISLLYSQGSEGLLITSNMTGSANIHISLVGENSINPDEHPTPWSKILKIFKQDSPPTLKDYELRVVLRPRELVPVMPGDVVDLYRLYNELNTPSIAVYGALHYPLTVDASGLLWIPPLSTTNSSFKPDDLKKNPRFRVLTAASDQQSYWIKVWDAGKPLEKQTNLEEIATCLSQACSLTEAKDGKCFRPHRCLSLGIDERFLPGTLNTTEVRYQLLPAKRYWTLIDEQGRSFQQEYRPGQRLVEAVRAIYSNATGVELFAPGTARERRIYIMVAGGVPYTDVNGNVGPEPPFYGEISPHRSSRLDDVLIHPRDHVFVLINDPAKEF